MTNIKKNIKFIAVLVLILAATIIAIFAINNKPEPEQLAEATTTTTEATTTTSRKVPAITTTKPKETTTTVSEPDVMLEQPTVQVTLPAETTTTSTKTITPAETTATTKPITTIAPNQTDSYPVAPPGAKPGDIIGYWLGIPVIYSGEVGGGQTVGHDNTGDPDKIVGHMG